MSLYNADELQSPEWLNKEFLEKILNHHENSTDEINLLEFKIEPATMKGDHYASVMFRTKVNYTYRGDFKNISMIIKTLPMEEGMKRDIIMNFNIFNTEIEMYTKVLPRIQKILADFGEPTKFAPNLIYQSMEPCPIIVLEDLCESGYKVIRGRFLHKNEMKLVYNKLAKLHAVSYILSENVEDQQLIRQFNNGIFCKSGIYKVDFIKNGLQNFLEFLSKHRDLQIYVERIKKFESSLFKECENLFKSYEMGTNKDAIFVLNHGDAHIKNLMFKYNANDLNKLEDVILVDYQCCCFGPSNIDIVYSQFLMCTPDIRSEVVKYYFDEFLKMLTSTLHYKGEIPLLKNFQHISWKYRHFSIFLISTFLPLFYAFFTKSTEALKDIDISDAVERPDLIINQYNDPQYLEAIRTLMPALMKEGYLDI